MKRPFNLLFLLFSFTNILCTNHVAPKKEIIGLRIGRGQYFRNQAANCSSCISVQIAGYPDINVKFNEKTTCVLKQKNDHNEVREVATGTFYKQVDQDYIFQLDFNKEFSVDKDGVLQAEWSGNPFYHGLLYEISKNAVKLDAMFGEYMTAKYFIYNENTKETESAIIDSFLAEYKRAVSETIRAFPAKGTPIEKGKFKHKYFADLLHAVSRDDVIEFLKFIADHPEYYFASVYTFNDIFSQWIRGVPENVLKKYPT